MFRTQHTSEKQSLLSNCQASIACFSRSAASEACQQRACQLTRAIEVGLQQKRKNEQGSGEHKEAAQTSTKPFTALASHLFKIKVFVSVPACQGPLSVLIRHKHKGYTLQYLPCSSLQYGSGHGSHLPHQYSTRAPHPLRRP